MHHALHGCAHQFFPSLSVCEPWQLLYCQCKLDFRFITFALCDCTVLLNIACLLIFTPQCAASNDCYVVKAVGCLFHRWGAEAAEQWERMQRRTNSIRRASGNTPVQRGQKSANLVWQWLVWPGFLLLMSLLRKKRMPWGLVFFILLIFLVFFFVFLFIFVIGCFVLIFFFIFNI